MIAAFSKFAFLQYLLTIFSVYFLWKKQQYENTVSSAYGGGSIIGDHHRRDYYIIPRNKLGQDIFIRATEIRGLSNISRMPSGDMKPLRVPVMKNMRDSHMKGKLYGKVRAMVTVLVADAEV